MDHRPLLLLFLGASCAVHADALTDENIQLKAQVQALQSRVDTLERACPAAAKINPVGPTATAATASTGKASASASASTENQSIVANANLDGTPQPVASEAPPPPLKKYADAGCDRGLFSGPQAGLWKSTANWNKVADGASMPEVETALGVEHYDIDRGKGRVQWEYGRCGTSWEGAVSFLNGKVVSLTPPDR